MIMVRKYLFILFFVLMVLSCSERRTFSGDSSQVEMEQGSISSLENWVDSVFNSLTQYQRIGQLFIIAANSNGGEENESNLERIVKRFNPGGICFFNGTPEAQAALTNRLQSAATVPLFIAMDAEWGPAMRLDGVKAFPHQITLGAITDDLLIYEMGLEIGNQLKRLGVNMSFSPVVDVNTNPQNPVINFRSFGESRENVTLKGLAYMRGLQDAGIISVAKHFPGHGDTGTDSHYELPIIDLTREEIDSVHLFPFRKLAKNGLNAIMVGHLDVPALDSVQGTPATLSKSIIPEILRRDWGFEGLVITDALNMVGATSVASQGKLEVKALQAGNDILLMPQNLEAAIEFIKGSIEGGDLCQEVVGKKVRKILKHKYLVGLNEPKSVELANLVEDLNNDAATLLNRKLAESAITLLQNKNNFVPLRGLEGKNIAVISLGAPVGNPFQKVISQNIDAALYSFPKIHPRSETNRILVAFKKYDIVILGIHRSNISVSLNYGVNNENIHIANQLAARQPTIITVFANPYSLSAFGKEMLQASAVLLGYQDGRHFEEAAAKVIVGNLGSKGKLPVSLKPLFPLFKGHKTMDNFIVNYSGSKKGTMASNNQ